ncbi:TonB-dependent receptor [Dyella sp. AtDHG13]|uniref:TonB-dependent siderophore receptor n=2 Tax=Gammaproteobacteria TaxID=1236 RepID=UPI001F292384|nr:TonB-dependent receptor [Dyella sp. AtDHG13]
MRKAVTLLLSGSLSMCVCLAVPGSCIGAPRVAAESSSQASRLDFAIPAQPLATALLAFGKQANVQVLTAGCTVARFRSLGATGNLTVQAALARLLEGTGLVYEFTGQGTVVITAPEAPGKKASPSAKPPEVRELTSVEANALIGRDVGFKASLTSIGSRNDADLIDVPQSVSVVTRDVMTSQQAVTVEDVVRNVAGVAYVDGADGLPLFQIRGFYTGNGLIDGMPNSNAGSGDFPPLVALDRVEVIKGPQSILGDSNGNSFGGLINVTTKQPQSVPLHEISYTLGERGQVQAAVDLTGPLGHDPRLTYRLVVSGDYADRSPQGYRNRRSGYLAPSIGWTSSSTQLVVGLQRILNRLPVPDHAVLLGDTAGSTTPFGLLTGNAYDYANYQTNRLYYLLDQQLGHAWTWRSRGQYVQQRNDSQGWTMNNPTLFGDTSPYAEAYRYSDAYYSMQNDFIRVFGTGPVTHTVTLGMDYSRSRVGRTDDAVHVYDGVYNLFADPALPRVSAVMQPDDNVPIAGSPWSVNSGLFLQDQLSLGEHWDMLVAARRSYYEVSSTDSEGNPWTPRRTKWVPNAGIVYKLTPDIAFYGGTSNGFQPLSYLGENGRPLVPALSRQLEVGAKLNLFHEQAWLAVSLYRIMLDHSYLFLEETPNVASFGPGQTNRGLEIEFAGRVAPGLDITGSYTNAQISNHDGTAPTGAPRQRFNLWASYWFQGGALKGWGIAGGVQARSRSLGQSLDYSTYFPSPGQAEVDANVSYRTDRWRMTLGVKNLFARTLYASDFNETFVPLRTRRSVVLSGAYDF